MKINSEITVLSCFDGMSCGQLALKRAGIKVKQYFASEIDQYAIEVTQANFPKTIQLGTVKNVKSKNLPKIDLLIGGSPCQGFSFAGNQLNFKDPRSKLFFEFVRILKEIRQTNPDVLFLLENVKMKQEYEDVITKQLCVEPIEINSNLVSAQNRKRLYWTNIPNITQPKDKGIMLKDIVHEKVDKVIPMGELNFNVSPSGKGIGGNVTAIQKGKSTTLMVGKGEGQKIAVSIAEYVVPFDKTLQILNKEVKRGKIGYFRKDSQANRVYYVHDKAVTLTGEGGGGAAKMGQYLFGVITPERLKKTQNGQRINDGNKFYTLTTVDKHGILVEGYIRKLTPIECERLQTVPDNYTHHVSKTQRYKMLGNGWTVNVIAHILRSINKDSKTSKLPELKAKMAIARKKLKLALSA